MRKLFTILATVLLILIPIQPVKAATFSGTISAPSKITAGDQFTVTFGVSNVTNMYGATIGLSFDTSKLTLVSSSGLNDFTLTQGTNLVVDRLTPKSGTFAIASVVFKAKTTFALGQTAWIKFGSDAYPISYANLTTDIYAAEKTKTINIKMVSDNSYLKSLTVSEGTLSFNKSTTYYKVVVENSVSSIAIAASPEYSKATVSGTGTKALSIYSNLFNVTVTAENGDKRTYTVEVQRKDENGLAAPPSTNAYLSDLVIDGVAIEFNKETLTYSVEVGNLISSLTVTPTLEDPKSTVDVSSTALAVGINTISVTVTAESGATRVYTITVNRSSDVPTVSEAQILEALGTATTDRIGLIQPASGNISGEVLSALKTSGKTLVVVAKDPGGKTLYEWAIDGTKISGTTPIKTFISFTSEHEAMIDSLTNYARGILLTFEENESLPPNTTVTLVVGDKFKDGEKVTLYYYEPSIRKLSANTKDLVVENGKVTFTLTHTSTYFVSPMILKDLGWADYLFVFVSIGEAAIIIVLLILLGSRSKRKRDARKIDFTPE
jgi:hypothetical protein